MAVKALVRLNAVDDCIAALNTPNRDMALWALRYMHDAKAVDAMIASHKESDDSSYRQKIKNNLARIYYKEADYDTSWWWSTRPDTHGPYYKFEEWEYSPVIRSFLLEEWKKASPENKEFFTSLNSKYRLGIDDFGLIEITAPKEDAPIVDLEKIKNVKGQIGQSSIEDIMIVLKQIKGDAEKGKALYKSQACYTCHSLTASEVMKGPFMGQIGSIMNREKIAESILKPNASISQGFASVLLKTQGGDSFVGFVTKETATEISIRNSAGIATDLKLSDIVERKELETSMMPAGLVNALSYEEMASLVAFLEQQK